MGSTLEYNYHKILQDILLKGIKKGDRTGTGTISLFGETIRHDMSKGFPLLTTKKMAFKTMVTELKWFLKGDTNIKYLLDNNCHIWDGDAYKQYERVCAYDLDEPQHSQKELMKLIQTDESYSHWGNIGPIYGKQWRNWHQYYTEKFNNGNPTTIERTVDQIETLIEQIKTNPDSRRLMVSAWNVGELDQMALPPCHYGFQVYTRELGPLEIIEQAKKDGLWKDTIPEGMTLGELQKDFKTREISLMWNQRSVDTFLGLPFNIASYGLLLELLASETNMVAGELIGNLGDTHLYLNHLEQAKEQISRQPYKLPSVKLSNVDLLNGEFDVELIGYKSHPSIKAPLSN